MDFKFFLSAMILTILMVVISFAEPMPQNTTQHSKLQKGIAKSKIELKQKIEKSEEKGTYKPQGPNKPPKKPKPSISYPIKWPTLPDKPIHEWDKKDWKKFCKSKDKYLPSRQPGMEGKMATVLRCYIELLSFYIMKHGK